MRSIGIAWKYAFLMSDENNGTPWHAANTATSACVSMSEVGASVRTPCASSKLPHDTNLDLNSGT